ncbi:RING-H2 finger protein ATL74-like [Cucurbita pepo subsp. pepo]|uniref:RING-H2 finger protein ATL74-like n=1 Tax=Cucurbita pepo subsp. pepo TaxID=3664 RepID=UPI000C9D6EDD|nr:RING-H2 finger protein ATL74-like [Cucurbita pepo subsp. pepo]
MPSSPPPPPPPSPVPDYSSWSPWSISIIAIVCIVVLLLSNYRILKRWCRVFHGLFCGRSVVQFDENPNDPSPQVHVHGLEASTIRLLPISQFKKNEEAESTASINTECAVCLGEFEEGELIKNLPNCNHSFHSSCIDAWLRNHSSCPLCRLHVSNLSIDCPTPDSSSAMLETLSREDVDGERVSYYQTLRAQILQNPDLRRDASVQGSDQRNR